MANGEEGCLILGLLGGVHSNCIGCIALNSRMTLIDKLQESDCSLFRDTIPAYG